MRVFGYLIVAALVGVAGGLHGGDARDEAIKKDRKKIEGTWRVVALEVDGSKASEDDARKLTVVNHPDGVWSLFREGEEISKGSSLMDPTEMLKTIDFTPTEGAGKGKDYVGIYELQDNTRKICFGEKSGGRPTEFASRAGSGHAFVTLEREKK